MANRRRLPKLKIVKKVRRVSSQIAGSMNTNVRGLVTNRLSKAKPSAKNKKLARKALAKKIKKLRKSPVTRRIIKNEIRKGGTDAFHSRFVANSR